MKIGNTWRLLDWWADTNGIGSVGGAPFTPAAITGLKLWLKADAGTFQDSIMTVQAVSDADPVGGWQDQSGNGKHVVQATSTKRGTLKLGANGQNGRAVVRGDGVDDFLASATVASTAVDNLTVFIACKITNVSDYSIAFGNGGGGGHRFGLFTNNNRLVNWLSGNMTDGAHTTNIFEVVQYGNSAGTWSMRVNGSAAALTPDNSVITTPAGTQVLANNAGANPSTVDIGEVLLYDAALTAQQIADVEAYLNARWAAF